MGQVAGTGHQRVPQIPTHLGEHAAPLELCSWKDREALPPVGDEYQQRFKRVNDRLPKAVSLSSIKLLVLVRCPFNGPHWSRGKECHRCK
ncbi:hypothetical protein HaLaN_01623, partial [Haematococcus lacustris]